jgi:hypothetical protein
LGATSFNTIASTAFVSSNSTISHTLRGQGQAAHAVVADWLVALGTAGSDSLTNRLNGGQLTTSNLMHNALSGLGGAAGTTYTAFPNRPVDDADVVSNDIIARQVVTVRLAWKNSTLFQTTVMAYLQQVATTHPGRSVKEAWYSYTGPSSWSSTLSTFAARLRQAIMHS